MNKDIQTLIESEACEHWSHSNYKEASEKAHSENDICKTSAMARKVSNSSFQAGASFALSLFKWRKVSEGLPEDNARVLVKSKGGRFYLSCYSKLDGFSSNANIFEWMPIPQID